MARRPGRDLGGAHWTITQRAQLQASCWRRKGWGRGAMGAYLCPWPRKVHPHTHLFDCVQHGPPSIPWLSGLAYAVEACHAVPLPVLQLPVEGVGQHQNTVIQVEVGDLQRQRW